MGPTSSWEGPAGMGGKAEGDWRKGEWSSLVGAQRRGNWGWRRILGVSAVGLQLPGEALMPSLVGNRGTTESP